jgi:F-type H+-transporting ATPase subunit d
MAGHKLALKTIYWIVFGEIIPPNQRTVAKSCNQTLHSWLANLSEKPPAIDWTYYEANVAKASIVDNFAKN